MTINNACAIVCPVMSEAIRTAMQYAPYAGAAIGAATGAVAEHVIQNRTAEERQPLNEIMGDQASQAQESSKIVRMGKKLIGPLAVAVAIAGAANGLAWQTQGANDQEPKLTLIGDRSGATDSPDSEGQPSPANKINSIVKEFSDHKGTSTEILVGKGGQVLEASPEGFLSDVRYAPFGNAPMPQAVNQAIENINSVSSLNSEKNSDDKNSIVVLTNGNQFGKTQDVIDSAKESSISIFIKDVSTSTSGGDIEGMKKIASETGGVYLDNSAKPEEIYDAVKDEVQSKKPEQQQTGDKHNIPEKAFIGLLSIFGVGMIARARRRMPITFNGTKIEK